MKVTKLYSSIAVMLTLTLSVPYLSIAHAAERHSTQKQKADRHDANKFEKRNHCRKNLKKKHATTVSIDSTQYGEGTRTTFKKVRDGVTKTFNIYTYASGKKYVTITTATPNSNGTTNYDVTTLLGGGKKTTNDKIVDANGDFTGVITQSNGQVEQEVGTKTSTSYGYDTQITITNAKDQTESLNDETLKEINAIANVVTGTGFNGQVIDNASLRATKNAGSSDTVDNTVNGPGTYTYSQTNGTVNTDRTFTNGAGNLQSTNIINNSNGTTSVNQMTIQTNATGAQSSTGIQLTESSPNSNGVEAVTGTFTQSNGHNGTVSGTKSTTDFGNVTALTYTDQNGFTRSTLTRQLVIPGMAILNENSGWTFTGISNRSAGLITGQAA